MRGCLSLVIFFTQKKRIEAPNYFPEHLNTNCQQKQNAFVLQREGQYPYLSTLTDQLSLSNYYTKAGIAPVRT